MTNSTIKTIGVVGAGQMGRGIAQVAAQSGLNVCLLDANKELAIGSVARIGKALDRLVSKERISQEVRETSLARISPFSDFQDLADCDLVVEAAPEREDIKIDIFTKLAAVTREDTILASNTSSISITKIAACTGRPEKVIGMHFMNPVPVMKLVEIVRGLATDDSTYEATVALAQRFGKTTVAARDIPGFIVNRILIPLINEACFALYEGLGSAEDIDIGIKLGLNHPMGPLELSDLIGLDTCLAIANVLHQELGDDKYRPCPLLKQHVAAGWLGRKSGRGFYAYDAQGKRVN
ncbi:MAG: 3-hydroxybutyryl-CoA dehydrogenase [Kofleriaceae bacterium]|nr:3-hydroxybutyryl-CoA dehydrogenase [Kofleriaceae bacterium]